jgi:membrane fusion protein (multidrug efflux system)
LKVGQSIRVTLDAVPGSTFDGEVYAIDPAHDPYGRSVILRARMPNKTGMLRSGMFARVILVIEDRKKSILVPETALTPVGQELFVFRVVSGKAKLTKVKIGLRRAGEVEILGGLGPEDVIVTEGILKIRDDTAVRANIAKAD